MRGGKGQLLSRILKLPGCNHVNGVLFDFPDVIERAKTFLAKEGIPDNRISFTMGNILKDVPQSTEVDTIIIKNLFVIFTDDDMIKVSLKHGSLILERVLLKLVNQISTPPHDHMSAIQFHRKDREKINAL